MWALKLFRVVRASISNFLIFKGGYAMTYASGIAAAFAVSSLDVKK